MIRCACNFQLSLILTIIAGAWTRGFCYRMYNKEAAFDLTKCENRVEAVKKKI